MREQRVFLRATVGAVAHGVSMARTPGSPANPALMSRVTIVRPVSAAWAAMMRSCAARSGVRDVSGMACPESFRHGHHVGVGERRQGPPRRPRRSHRRRSPHPPNHPIPDLGIGTTLPRGRGTKVAGRFGECRGRRGGASVRSPIGGWFGCQDPHRQPGTRAPVCSTRTADLILARLPNGTRYRCLASPVLTGERTRCGPIYPVFMPAKRPKETRETWH